MTGHVPVSTTVPSMPPELLDVLGSDERQVHRASSRAGNAGQDRLLPSTAAGVSIQLSAHAVNADKARVFDPERDPHHSNAPFYLRVAIVSVLTVLTGACLLPSLTGFTA